MNERCPYWTGGQGQRQKKQFAEAVVVVELVELLVCLYSVVCCDAQDVLYVRICTMHYAVVSRPVTILVYRTRVIPLSIASIRLPFLDTRTFQTSIPSVGYCSDSENAMQVL